MGTTPKRALCTDTRAYAKGSVYIKDGHKYAICEQCGLDWNVSWQFVGWYVCPVCRNKKRKETRNDPRRTASEEESRITGKLQLV